MHRRYQSQFPLRQHCFICFQGLSNPIPVGLIEKVMKLQSVFSRVSRLQKKAEVMYSTGSSKKGARESGSLYGTLGKKREVGEMKKEKFAV